MATGTTSGTTNSNRENGYADEELQTPNNDVNNVSSTNEQKVRILVLGKRGSGKTTLVKSFLGDSLGNDNGVDSGSHGNGCVDAHSTSICGVVLEFYDTPGLADPEISDKKLLQSINNDIPQGINLVLVCMRMDQEIDQDLVCALREVSNVYGSALWKRTIFVLTFANVYALGYSAPTDQKPNDKDVASTMSTHVNEFVELLHKRLVEDARWLYSVNESVFRDIPFCMAGINRKDNKDLVLPTTQDWVQDLLVACTSQSTTQTIVAPKINQDKKRILVEVGTVGTSAVVGGAAGAFIGGTLGTIAFPGVGTVVGAGIGSLIGGGIGTAAVGGTVVGVRVAESKRHEDSTDQLKSSSTTLVDRSKQLLNRVKTKFKK